MRNKFDCNTLLVDTPTLVMIGASLGFLIVGVILTTLGALIDAEEGSLWHWPTLFAGFANIALSSLVALIGFIYWKLILKRKGQLFPRLLGFGLLPALMSLLSAALIGIDIYFGLLTYLIKAYE